MSGRAQEGQQVVHSSEGRGSFWLLLQAEESLSNILKSNIAADGCTGQLQCAEPLIRGGHPEQQPNGLKHFDESGDSKNFRLKVFLMFFSDCRRFRNKEPTWLCSSDVWFWIRIICLSITVSVFFPACAVIDNLVKTGKTTEARDFIRRNRAATSNNMLWQQQSVSKFTSYLLLWRTFSSASAPDTYKTVQSHRQHSVCSMTHPLVY